MSKLIIEKNMEGKLKVSNRNEGAFFEIIIPKDWVYIYFSSFIGKFISAAKIAKAISKYHIQVKFPLWFMFKPPKKAPKKPPVWWLSRVKPNKVPKYFVPKSFAIIPAVGGTVASQVKPKDMAKI